MVVFLGARVVCEQATFYLNVLSFMCWSDKAICIRYYTNNIWYKFYCVINPNLVYLYRFKTPYFKAKTFKNLNFAYKLDTLPISEFTVSV